MPELLHLFGNNHVTLFTVEGAGLGVGLKRSCRLLGGLSLVGHVVLLALKMDDFDFLGAWSVGRTLMLQLSYRPPDLSIEHIACVDIKVRGKR